MNEIRMNEIKLETIEILMGMMAEYHVNQVTFGPLTIIRPVMIDDYDGQGPTRAKVVPFNPRPVE